MEKRWIYLALGLTSMCCLLAILVGGALVARLRKMGRRGLGADDMGAWSKWPSHFLALLRKIMDTSSEACLLLDGSLRVCLVNQGFCQMSGFSGDEMLGRDYSDFALALDSSEGLIAREIKHQIVESGSWAGEIQQRRRDGQPLSLKVNIDCLRSDRDDPLFYVCVATDLSRIKETEKRLDEVMRYDILTGLPNRVSFLPRLAEAIEQSRASESRAALIAIDLLNFKDVNDRYGHACGDRILTEVARCLVGLVQGGDAVCRLAGDEFVVILQDIGGSEPIGDFCQEIMERLEGPYVHHDKLIHLGACLGVAVFPEDGHEAEKLLRMAEAALYLAKEDGRPAIRFASRRIEVDNARRMELEALLVRALERGEFSLRFQPIYATGGIFEPGAERLLGAEALIRWIPSDGRGPIAPDDFIPVVERMSIMAELEEWILGEACREAVAWRDLGWRHPLKVSVNFSARQFEDPSLLDTVRRAMSESGLPPACLQIELTESSFMRDVEGAAQIMAEIKKLGVAIAIDDFGKGYSSLGYLSRFPVDAIKIDKAFVDSMLESEVGSEVATAIISMARAFRLRSVAEGVEHKAQLEALVRRGCDEVQGYYMAKPLSSADFRELVGRMAKESYGELEPVE